MAWTAAEDQWTKALTKLWYRVGNAALSLKRYKDAEESLQQAADYDSTGDKMVKKKLAEAKAHVKRVAKKQLSLFKDAFGGGKAGDEEND